MVLTALLAIAVFLTKRTVGAWVGSLFDKALERYRTAQAKELQGLEHEHQTKLEGIRFQLEKLSHRAQRIHDKEIDVLSELWRRLKNAEGATFLLVTFFSKHSDFDAMPEELLKETVARLDWPEFNKSELLKAPKKNELYRRLMAFKNHNEAEKATNDFSNYVIENAPFLSEELKSKSEELIRALRGTAIREEISRQAREQGATFPPKFEEWDQVAPLARDVEHLIRQRLRYSEA
jgi:hypothetical protein